ncbi:MAG: DUF523 domain-containing protein [Clostridia bacterium]|nr:MAG: DUF523 domain-containing protein [Clostridia bacterium]
MYLISACLAGLNCRHDAQIKPVAPEIARDLARGGLWPVCPEQLGGLTTPRPPAEIVGGTGADVWRGQAKVVTADGRDVTPAFLAGARQVLELARSLPVQGAILKEKSPSCGVKCIYDGTFSRLLRPGPGVTAALLAASGIPCLTDDHAR